MIEFDVPGDGFPGASGQATSSSPTEGFTPAADSSPSHGFAPTADGSPDDAPAQTSLPSAANRKNRRDERHEGRNDDERGRRRGLDASAREEPRQDLNHRYTGGRNRSPMPWPTGPTRPLPSVLTDAVARPTIPSAREETVELPPLATPPGPAPVRGPAAATPTATGHPAGVPTQPDHTTADRSTPRAGRTATDEALPDVWALVDRAQAGDSDAFAQIYHRYLDTVFRFVYFRVGNRQVAEDLTAETFLRALRRIGSVTWQGRDLGAWLVTIARNLVADYFKSGRYRFEVTTGDVHDGEAAVRGGVDSPERGPEGSPEAAVVDHITNVALLSAVQRLNPEQRECIVLRFLQGFSVAETAQVMGKNEGAIKALQYRAIRTLHRLLPEGFQS